MEPLEIEIDQSEEMGVSTQSKEDISRSLIFKNMFIHLLTCGFTAFLTYLSFANGMTLFSWHVPLMSFGVSILYSGLHVDYILFLILSIFDFFFFSFFFSHPYIFRIYSSLY